MQPRRGFVRSVLDAILPTLRYWTETEVHALAFSVAANVLLGFFPFLIVSVSISRTPLGTICGAGRTSNRDAGVTPESLGIADKRLKTSVRHVEATTATGRPKAAGETSGKDDMEPQDFRERQGHDRL